MTDLSTEHESNCSVRVLFNYTIIPGVGLALLSLFFLKIVQAVGPCKGTKVTFNRCKMCDNWTNKITRGSSTTAPKRHFNKKKRVLQLWDNKLGIESSWRNQAGQLQITVGNETNTSLLEYPTYQLLIPQGFLLYNVWFQKISIPTPRRVTEIPRGMGV